MAVLGCNHVGIQVRDVEVSTAFYVEHLGFERVNRWSLSQPYLRQVVGYPTVTLEVAMLTIPGSDLLLEILEYRDVERAPVDPATANPGTAHFCLLVDDLDGLYADLRSKGVDFVSEPETPTRGPNEGGRIVYMKDPDGIRVELIERRPGTSDR